MKTDQQTTERLFELSQKARSSFRASLAIYACLAPAAEALGASQENLLRIIETIQKGFTIGGATQAEAFGAAIQLSQGIASDRFGGEAFKSVAETAPVLLQKMARSMGVTTGKLREMAHAGELTGKVVTGAILKSAVAIDEMFATSIVTVGQALTRLRNAIIQYFSVEATL